MAFERAADRPPGTSVPVVDGRSGALCYPALAPEWPGRVKAGGGAERVAYKPPDTSAGLAMDSRDPLQSSSPRMA